MKNTYFSTAIGLYLNYPVHGTGVILMSLDMSLLERQWQTNATGVSVVTSSLGIGCLSVLLVAGMLSDRYGRRSFIILGMTCYMIFFIGIINTHSIFLAYALGFLAGMANSFLDAGTYPNLMEAFPHSPSIANILIKASVSSGRFLPPMIISLLVWSELWFDWSFLLAAVVMMLNSMFLFRCRFPPHLGPHTVIRAQPAGRGTTQPEHRCSLLDLASYILCGYIAVAIFCLVNQWLARYGQLVVGMSYTLSIKLLSIYTCGFLLCVLITAPLARKAERATSILMLYTLISFAALLMVCLHLAPYVVIIFVSVIGFSFAGDVVQIGLALMVARFPYAKGKATGIYYSAGSIATFTIPLITTKLSETSIAHVMWLDTGITAIGFLLVLFIGYRSHIASKHQLKMIQAVE